MAEYSYGEERKRKKEAEGLFVEGERGLSQGRNSKGETMCERRYLDRGEGEEYFSLSESDEANERSFNWIYSSLLLFYCVMICYDFV